MLQHGQPQVDHVIELASSKDKDEARWKLPPRPLVDISKRVAKGGHGDLDQLCAKLEAGLDKASTCTKHLAGVRRKLHQTYTGCVMQCASLNGTCALARSHMPQHVLCVGKDVLRQEATPFFQQAALGA